MYSLLRMCVQFTAEVSSVLMAELGFLVLFLNPKPILTEQLLPVKNILSRYITAANSPYNVKIIVLNKLIMGTSSSHYLHAVNLGCCFVITKKSLHKMLKFVVI